MDINDALFESRPYGAVWLDLEEEGTSFFLSYKNHEISKEDVELQWLYTTAGEAVAKFYDYVKRKIEEKGVSIDDFEY